ncbi:unnamed protein product [Hermetia illucens]|uniref:Uncharacterized protein n=1 Tax=Hermetia illucens TaxID=343691 RepID=A0A7R8YY40_HERIL|nr:unnamed protein product [Hermetia illucens]
MPLLLCSLPNCAAGVKICIEPQCADISDNPNLHKHRRGSFFDIFSSQGLRKFHRLKYSQDLNCNTQTGFHGVTASTTSLTCKEKRNSENSTENRYLFLFPSSSSIHPFHRSSAFI